MSRTAGRKRLLTVSRNVHNQRMVTIQISFNVNGFLDYEHTLDNSFNSATRYSLTLILLYFVICLFATRQLRADCWRNRSAPYGWSTIQSDIICSNKPSRQTDRHAQHVYDTIVQQAMKLF